MSILYEFGERRTGESSPTIIGIETWGDNFLKPLQIVSAKGAEHCLHCGDNVLLRCGGGSA
jgi:hypothetical protein